MSTILKLLIKLVACVEDLCFSDDHTSEKL